MVAMQMHTRFSDTRHVVGEKRTIKKKYCLLALVFRFRTLIPLKLRQGQRFASHKLRSNDNYIFGLAKSQDPKIQKSKSRNPKIAKSDSMIRFSFLLKKPTQLLNSLRRRRGPVVGGTHGGAAEDSVNFGLSSAPVAGTAGPRGCLSTHPSLGIALGQRGNLLPHQRQLTHGIAPPPPTSGWAQPGAARIYRGWYQTD